jgi:hypothetical protein
MDGKKLRALFQEFNAQYFGSKLPSYSIRAVEGMTDLGEAGLCNRPRKLIKILRSLSDEDAISCLLHEMAHAATSGHHGMPWKREMIRLRDAGAPLVSADLRVELTDWDGQQVSRTHFRRVVQGILVDTPNVTLHDAITHFIRTEGGPTTIKKFRRKFSWAATVFQAEKVAHAENASRVDALRATLAKSKP